MRRAVAGGVLVAAVGGGLLWWGATGETGETVASPPTFRPPGLSADQTATVRAELQAINEAYRDLHTLGSVVSYVVRDLETGEVVHREEGHLQRTDDLLVWRLGEVEVLSSDRAHVTLDHEGRTVVLRPPAPTPDLKDGAAFAEGLVDVVGRCDSAQAERDGQFGVLRLVCPASSFARIEVRYGLDDHLFEQLIVEPRPSPAVAEGRRVALEVSYSDAAGAEPSEMDVADLLPDAAGRLSGPVAGYELVDLRAGVAALGEGWP